MQWRAWSGEGGFLKASFRGCIYCRDALAACVDIVLAAEAAIDALKADGIDVNGAGYRPTTVVVTRGGE